MKRGNALLIVLILVVLVAGGGFYWFTYMRKASLPVPNPMSAENPSLTAAAPAVTADAALGAVLFEENQNPLDSKLPESVASVPDAVGTLYRNPFE